MLQIKNSWGEIVCQSDDIEVLKEFAVNYKKENQINFLKVTTETGMFYSFI